MDAKGQMIGYCSAVGKGERRELLRRHGWGLVMTPSDPRFPPAGFRYFIDNGAWSAHQKGVENDLDAFARYVYRFGECADFIVAPDIVEGGLESLKLSMSWIGRLSRYPGELLIAVQDGMTEKEIFPILERFDVGLFVGGSTEWKLRTLPIWGSLSKRFQCYLHVGRVNSARRIALCALAGVDSIDGSTLLLNPTDQKATALSNALRQPALFLDCDRFSRSEVS
jgi:hypothetical protein